MRWRADTHEFCLLRLPGSHRMYAARGVHVRTQPGKTASRLTSPPGKARITVFPRARVVELVDTRDLKSLDPKGSCRFESGLGHHDFSSLGQFLAMRNWPI